MNTSIPAQQWRDLVGRYDLSGPRYTSYPTALQFRPEFALADQLEAMLNSQRHNKPLSLYFHLPFCQSLCYYCGCNKVVTRNRNRVDEYLQSLAQEMEHYRELVGIYREVRQLHWGGGTPTYLSHKQMAQLMALTLRYFNLACDDSAEHAVEIHPGQTAVETIEVLRGLGFNRLSMGVQDFNPQVQAAVNRFNSEAQVRDLVERARQCGFHSINMDLIYGLPHQSLASFTQTLDSVIQLRPNRLSLFSYAHMPAQIKSQRLIHSVDLPAAEVKLQIFSHALEQLQREGYVHIGMDHFALETDDLVLAQRENRLQRNFQGYATGRECDLIGLGVSSISSVGNVYWQNQKSVKDYQQALNSGRLPVERGVCLTRDDVIRRWAITQLMCHYRLDWQELGEHFGVIATDYFATELEALAELERDGLLTLSDDGLEVSRLGKMVIRRIAMVFDAYLAKNPRHGAGRYSKVI
ncbi:oxygen-independent coproporphyrinogen III oxidase [Gilvimarinus sp. DA14]|uniref:oxygen-independent coproporphyrinogen III oxidase n=1 Tax=Gilvimarinus sp. DA14 TaxID=2956798 RepID=UPI0020B6F5B2|nr:oxygen-independent coproporphyrinogen III oxidase [Gilvimarinus sp. DA14]UTF60159.1 oxygen-independent coproporphyrinogen III oxidase [Gilvimarinus sp. DA14]